jgi:hypothetical protein
MLVQYDSTVPFQQEACPVELKEVTVKVAGLHTPPVFGPQRIPVVVFKYQSPSTPGEDTGVASSARLMLLELLLEVIAGEYAPTLDAGKCPTAMPNVPPLPAALASITVGGVAPYVIG